MSADREETTEVKHDERSRGSFYRESCWKMLEKERQRAQRKVRARLGTSGVILIYRKNAEDGHELQPKILQRSSR